MKKLLLTAIGVAALISLIAPMTRASMTEDSADEDSTFSGGAEAAIYSKYIWRGAELNSEGVFQPEVWLSYMNGGVSVWGNLDLTNINDRRGDFTEIDYEAFYSFEIRGVGASLLYLYYDYPLHDAEKTQEIGLELEWGEPLKLGLEVYYDFDLVRGTYLKPSVSYALELEPITLVPTIALGWGSDNSNAYNFDVSKNALVDLEISLAATMELESGFYISLLGSGYLLVDQDLRDETGDAKDGWWGGGSIGFEF